MHVDWDAMFIIISDFDICLHYSKAMLHSSKSYRPRRSGCYEFTTTVETHFAIIVKKNLPET